MSKLDTRVIQVTNVAPTTTKEQLKTLFQFIGRIRDCKLFPPEGSDQQVAAKVCYVEFEDSTAAGVALHLTNTVFIDRALIVVPVMDGKIPDEKVAMQLTPQTVARMAPGQPSWPTNVVSQLAGTGTEQAITTYDPRLNALGLPQYPPLPASLDAAKVEEIRRTVYIGNLDPKTTPESLISFFSQAGEVKYVRMAGEDTSVARAAYLELTDQRSVANYLGYNGVSFNGRTITVSHAKSSINKPLTKSQEASRREVEEAMKKVQEAQSLISAAAAGHVTEKFTTRSRSRSRRRSRSRGSRSRSRSKRRSRSRSRGRRRRSRSRSRRKSRSPRRVRRSRSRSPRRRRSRSRSGFVVIPPRERRRSRSNSRPRRRSRSRSNRRRSRTPPRAYSARRSRSRSRGTRRKSRSRTPRRSRSRSRGKGKEKKEKKEKESEKKKKEKEKKVSMSRSPSPPTLQREGSAAPHSGDDRSPARLDPSEPAPASGSKKTRSEAASDKKSSHKSEAASDRKSSRKRDRSDSPAPARRGKSVSRSPVRSSRRRSGSRSPVKSSRRRSVSPRKRRSKSRSPRRSRSPAKKKKARSPRRSRSGSRHRSKKDKKKERSRSRERKEKEKKKKSKDKDKEREREKKEDKEKSSSSSSSKVAPRNYDEEEKGFNSAASDHEEEMRSPGGDVEEDQRSNEGDRQLVDMDTSD
ncbi:uncharacterized protein LOC143295270 isoform X23 [Babylonia areolata]|uniref:uncharacterized protein LOC143295270 isoform X22 n=1 Tax=Babylonia areolata TaxID=304850 RepID=UPI003FD28673